MVALLTSLLLLIDGGSGPCPDKGIDDASWAYCGQVFNDNCESVFEELACTGQMNDRVQISTAACVTVEGSCCTARQQLCYKR